MIIPKIDGGKPTIVYTDGYNPVSVYVDGELQTPISAIPETAQGESNILNILTEYDKAIKNLEISGATLQNGTPTPESPIPIENANANGMSVIVHGNNLFNQNALLADSRCDEYTYNGVECIIFNNGGTFDIPFEVPANTAFSFSYERAFPKADFYWFFKFDDGTFDSSGFTSAYYPNTSQETFEKVIKRNLIRTKKIVAIQMRFYGSINSGYYPMYLRNIMANIGTTDLPYEPYFREEISIPTEITSTTEKPIISNGITLENGATVPLLMSEWDKLTVDRIANNVIYTEGSWQREMTGTENWFESEGAAINGWGKIYVLPTGRDYNVQPTNFIAYCNYYKTGRYIDGNSPNNSIYAYQDEGGLIEVITDKVSPVADFKAMLQEKYAEGNPVVVLVKRTAANTIQHDITMTDLGQALLSLNLQRNQTNILEIVSNLSAPQVPTNLTYYIWGGRNENESNA